MYTSTKTYGHEVGLSSCFRQHRAQSHCRLLHGYALSITLEFVARDLDERNWVVDFGSLKSFKGVLQDTFDHKLLVAADDPQLDDLIALEKLDPPLADVMVLPAVGCEAFAELIWGVADVWLVDNGYAPRVRLASVEVREHGANSAVYHGAIA